MVTTSQYRYVPNGLGDMKYENVQVANKDTTIYN